MIDEIWHFVNGKKKNYGFGVSLTGSRVSLWDGSAVIVAIQPYRLNTKTCVFVTKEWSGFFRLLPEDRHFCGKDLTYPIEQTNRVVSHLLKVQGKCIRPWLQKGFSNADHFFSLITSL